MHSALLTSETRVSSPWVQVAHCLSCTVSLISISIYSSTQLPCNFNKSVREKEVLFVKCLQVSGNGNQSPWFLFCKMMLGLVVAVVWQRCDSVAGRLHCAILTGHHHVGGA